MENQATLFLLMGRHVHTVGQSDPKPCGYHPVSQAFSPLAIKLEVKIPLGLHVSTIFQNWMYLTLNHQKQIRNRPKKEWGTGPVGKHFILRKPTFKKTCRTLDSVYAISCV